VMATPIPVPSIGHCPMRLRTVCSCATRTPHGRSRQASGCSRSPVAWERALSKSTGSTATFSPTPRRTSATSWTPSRPAKTSLGRRKSERSDVYRTPSRVTSHREVLGKPPVSSQFPESGRPDSNRGPPVPQTGALTRLRHAPFLANDSAPAARADARLARGRNYRGERPVKPCFARVSSHSEREEPVHRHAEVTR
jgi:hypothetical protein